ncbi:hypothetical protein ACEPAG_6763 [Sanghuangporus baumii]
MAIDLVQLSDTVKTLDKTPGGTFCDLNDSLKREEVEDVCTLRLVTDSHAALDSDFTSVREEAPIVERHHNLMTLPDEIFLYIISLACEDAPKGKPRDLRREEMDRLMVNLSLVSRKFRNAVINTPSLWASIDNRYCLCSGFDERIERSKGLLLILDIDLGFGVKSDGERRNILSRIITIKDRCQRLRAVVDAKAAKEVPAAEFSAAEPLELFFFGCRRNDWSRVFKKWAFPNVTSLLIGSAIPPPGLFPNVTTCTLIYGLESTGTGEFSYERLIQMLASIPQLTHLSVYFRDSDIPLPIDLVPVVLPSVSIITLGDYLGFNLSRVSPRLGRILASLILPNVKDTHLRLQFTTADQLLTWADSISPASERLREVTSLTIIGPSDLTRNTMHTLLALFRNIRRLELKTYGILKTLRDLEENLELNQLRTFIPREPNSTEAVHIERGDLDKLTQYPDAVHIA